MLINEQIKEKEVLVIGPKGEQLGLKSIEDALTLAKERNIEGYTSMKKAELLDALK